LESWEFLKEDIKTTDPKLSFAALNLNAVHQIREFALGVFIFAFLHSPFLQVFPLVLIFGYCLGVLARNMPFSECKLNAYMLINETAFFVMLVDILIMHVNADTMSLKNKTLFHGRMLIWVVVLTITMNVVVGLVSSIFTLMEYFA
jgi:hypothetical protein